MSTFQQATSSQKTARVINEDKLQLQYVRNRTTTAHKVRER